MGRIAGRFIAAFCPVLPRLAGGCTDGCGAECWGRDCDAGGASRTGTATRGARGEVTICVGGDTEGRAISLREPRAAIGPFFWPLKAN